MTADNSKRSVDWEEVGRQHCRDARRSTAEQIWRGTCPPALQDSDWSHPKLVPFEREIKRVLSHPYGKKGLLLSGTTGTGKSRSMWRLMYRYYVNEERDVKFYSAAGFFDALQSKLKYGNDEAGGFIECVAKHSVLFIDDLGQEPTTHVQSKAGWAKCWLLQLLDLRLGLGLPLFVTTNLDSLQLLEYCGEIRGDPLLRRLLELCDVIRFDRPEGIQRTSKTLTPQLLETQSHSVLY